MGLNSRSNCGITSKKYIYTCLPTYYCGISLSLKTCLSLNHKINKIRLITTTPLAIHAFVRVGIMGQTVKLRVSNNVSLE